MVRRRADLSRLHRRGGLTFPQIDDTTGEVYGRFKIPYQPAAVLISTDGTWQVTREELNVATIGDLIRS